jgi:NTP pyrophosphatase (non-canonical NTP hydrolase)
MQTETAIAAVNETLFVDAFANMQKAVYMTAKEKGWYSNPKKELAQKIIAGPGSENLSIEVYSLLVGIANQPVRNNGELIALAHSELSEALEGLRHDNPPDDKIPEFSSAEAELADLVIRAMDMAQANGWNLSTAIVAKAKFNQTRPHKHGGKAF